MSPSINYCNERHLTHTPCITKHYTHVFSQVFLGYEQHGLTKLFLGKTINNWSLHQRVNQHARDNATSQPNQIWQFGNHILVAHNLPYNFGTMCSQAQPRNVEITTMLPPIVNSKLGSILLVQPSQINLFWQCLENSEPGYTLYCYINFGTMHSQAQSGNVKQSPPPGSTLLSLQCWNSVQPNQIWPYCHCHYNFGNMHGQAKPGNVTITTWFPLLPLQLWNHALPGLWHGGWYGLWSLVTPNSRPQVLWWAAKTPQRHFEQHVQWRSCANTGHVHRVFQAFNKEAMHSSGFVHGFA